MGITRDLNPLWIVKLANTEGSFYPLLLKKIRTINVGLLEGNINVIQNFVGVCLVRTQYLLSEKELLFSGDIQFIPGSTETAEIPIVL